MIFFIHTLFMASFVWMILHFWRQLPLLEQESATLRMREFIVWSGKGVAAPLLVWILMNLGLTRWMPPFLPQVDVAKNAGGFSFWVALRYASPAMSVIVSYWAAVSLLVMIFRIREHTEDRAGFKFSLLLWSGFMLPLSAVSLWIGGWSGAGFAVVVWLAPVVHGALPTMVFVKRAPSYSQAIAKIKFGKYAEAEWQVIKELEQCQNDFNGWMMLAELYAVHFHDFKQAEQTVVDLCEQPDISASDVGVALHRLADWYLRLENDPQGARRCMEAISKRFPRTHLDKMARIRLRRIPRTREQWLDENRNKPLHLPALHEDLLDERELPVDTAQVGEKAEVLSRELSRNPNDTVAREEFARALAGLGRLQAAIEEVDLLLAMDGQMQTRRAKWMGLKADWMIRLQPENADVLNLLRRIIQDYPHSPQAVTAQGRIFYLDEQARLAKYAETKQKKPRIVIHLNPEGKDATGAPPNNI